MISIQENNCSALCQISKWPGRWNKDTFRDAPVNHVHLLVRMLFLFFQVSFVLQTLHLHLQRKGILDNLWQHTELISTRTIWLFLCSGIFDIFKAPPMCLCHLTLGFSWWRPVTNYFFFDGFDGMGSKRAARSLKTNGKVEEGGPSHQFPTHASRQNRQLRSRLLGTP